MVQVITTEKQPIKMWLKDIENSALEQAKNLANLPFLHKHVAMMADCHLGFGMPIGGVIATKGVIIPNAVGVDCGCGMRCIQTNIPASILKDTQDNSGKNLLKCIQSVIRRTIPIGFKRNDIPQEWAGFNYAPEIDIIQDNLEVARVSLSSLGGGNHFIELQRDDDGSLYIMVHSGSRNLGKQICNHYNQIAKTMNETWFSQVPTDWGLSFLPLESSEGQEYKQSMDFALEFARENRRMMMEKIKNITFNVIGKYYGKLSKAVLNEIDIHHNYAAVEHHYNTNVVVHRKGATRARKDELGIIPGSQGTSSYIVIGKGNKESFMSCSHGAGRMMSRKEAKRTLSLEEEKGRLDQLGVVHSVRTQDDLDEAPGAYKDIDIVMANQTDLVDIQTKLIPLAVIKG